MVNICFQEGAGLSYKGFHYISQLKETFYQGRQESLTVSTYSLSIVAKHFFQIIFNFQGLGPDGTYGLFPANYVEIIDSSELQFE